MTNVEKIVRTTARNYFLSWPNYKEIGRASLEDMIVDKVVEDIAYAKPAYEGFEEDGYGIHINDEFFSFEDIERVSLDESEKIWASEN